MKWIQAKTDYQGSDPETDEEFTLAAGQIREVSDEKAEQLERDFPDDFEFSDEAPDEYVPDEGNPPPPGGTEEPPPAAPIPGEEEPPSPEEVREALEKMKREELDELAGSIGVSNAEGLANKGEVVDAIIAAQDRHIELSELAEGEDPEALTNLAIELGIDTDELEGEAELRVAIIEAETSSSDAENE